MAQDEDVKQKTQGSRQLFDDEMRRKAFMRKLALLLRKGAAPKPTTRLISKR